MDLIYISQQNIGLGNFYEESRCAIVESVMLKLLADDISVESQSEKCTI